MTLTATPPDVPVPAERPPEYIGLVTRTLAFAVDAAVINAVAAVTAAVAALVVSIVSVPTDVEAAVIAAGGVLYVLWTVGYFVTFWATTGQTPGDRALRIRVVSASDGRIYPRRALLRFAALWLAALPLFAGYLLILFDERRRGLHDVIARTVVIDASADEGPPPPGPRRPPQPPSRSRTMPPITPR